MEVEDPSSSHTDLSRSQLDTELASQTAKELAECMSSLSQRLQLYPYQGELGRPELGLGEAARAVILTRYHSPPGVEFESWQDQLSGLGPGAPIIRPASRWRSAADLVRLGVQAEHELQVLLHTDEPTEMQARLLQAQYARQEYPDVPWFRTYYYFDLNGHFAKLAHQPEGMRDPRPCFDEPWLEKGPDNPKTVVSAMTPADFETAGYALHRLDRRLKLLEDLAAAHR